MSSVSQDMLTQSGVEETPVFIIAPLKENSMLKVKKLIFWIKWREIWNKQEIFILHLFFVVNEEIGGYLWKSDNAVQIQLILNSYSSRKYFHFLLLEKRKIRIFSFFSQGYQGYQYKWMWIIFLNINQEKTGKAGGNRKIF